jgi:hypothetical protein
MRQHSLIAFLIALVYTTSCNDTSDTGQKASDTPRQENTAHTPIEGNWELVSYVDKGKVIDTRKAQQFKAFHDGFFYVIMYDSLGNFYMAGAGPYGIDGKTYKETFTYYSDTTYIGSSDWQEWEMKGDTLQFKGFTKGLMADGRDVTDEWGRSTFDAKFVRARK